MLPLNYPIRWRIAGVLLLLAVVAFAMAPVSNGPDWNVSDKWAHGVTFAILAIWYCGQYAPRAYVWIALGLLIFGALIEVGQSMLTYRTAELADLSADLLGIVAGITIALVGFGGWSLRVERWLQKKFG